MVYLGYTTHLLKGKESFFCPEGTEGSEVAALSGHNESLQDLFFHTESEHRLVRKVHNWMSQTAAGHQEIEGEFFCLLFTRATTTSLAESGRLPGLAHLLSYTLTVADSQSLLSDKPSVCQLHSRSV